MKVASVLSFTAVVFALSPLAAQSPRPLDQLAAKLEPTRRVVYKRVGDRQLRLHIFEPRGHRISDQRPVFLTIHGGGWTGGHVRRSYPIADYFSRHGMLGISLEYRLVDRDAGTTVFDCVKDGRSAVRYLRLHAKQLGVDPAAIVVSGNSAGGHVAAGTALFDGIDEVTDDLSVPCSPNALVLYYAVLDTSKNGYGQEKIGRQWKTLSPVDRIKAGLPPTLVFHGTADSVTPYAGAQLFQQRMKAAGNQCRVISYKGGRHGYFIFDRKLFDQAMDRTRQFLSEVLR